MTTGFFFRADAAEITDPVANETLVLQTTSASGRTAGQLYVWNGSTWFQITTTGGSGITQLTGDVTAGPGSGSQAAQIAANAVGNAEIANSAVTLAKIANAAANSKVLGSGSAGSGSPYSEITLGANLQMTGTTLSATGGAGATQPAGSPTQVQFNDGGSPMVFGADGPFTYDKANNILSVPVITLALGANIGVDARAMTTNITLTLTDERYLLLDPDGDHDLIMPAKASGLAYLIANASPASPAITITITDDASPPNTIDTIVGREALALFTDGLVWVAFKSTVSIV